MFAVRTCMVVFVLADFSIIAACRRRGAFCSFSLMWVRGITALY